MVLVVVAMGCSTDPARSPDGRASPTRVPAQPTPPAAATPSPGPPSLDDLPTGPPPRIAYADRGVIVHPNGRRERLIGQRRIGVSAFTPFRGGWLVADTRFFEGTVGLAYVAGRTRVDLGPCATGGGVLSGDEARVAWITQGCPEAGVVAPSLVHVARVTGGREEAREVDRVGVTQVVGHVGDQILLSGSFEGVELVGPGGVSRPLPGLAVANDVSGDGLVAGRLQPRQRLGAVVDLSTGAILWSRRDTEPQLFSPSGTHLLGQVGRRPALLDATTGEVVAMVSASRFGLDGWAWEDDRHLVARAWTDQHQALVRVDLRGRVTRIGPVTGVDPWGVALETRP